MLWKWASAPFRSQQGYAHNLAVNLVHVDSTTTLASDLEIMSCMIHLLTLLLQLLY